MFIQAVIHLIHFPEFIMEISQLRPLEAQVIILWKKNLLAKKYEIPSLNSFG